jgi:parvulin-like peptidyl-prolyl isomerase
MPGITRRVIAAIALALFAAGLPVATAGAAEDINRVVLRVNNEIATLFQYEERKAVEITRILGNPNLDPDQRQEQLDKVGQNVMQNLFSELLLVSFADQQGIRVSDSEVDDALKQVMERQGMQNMAELQQALDAYGMSLEQLRSNLERDLLWNQVVGREVHAKIQVGEEELRAAYRNQLEEYKVPERRWLKEIIVLEAAEVSDEELEARAVSIYDEISQNEDFEAAVAPHEASGQTTGVLDLGWLKQDELELELGAVAWGLEQGEVSVPVHGRGGLHIFYLQEKEEARVLPFHEVEDQLRAKERGVRFDKELRSFLARVEGDAYIQENLPSDAVGYRRVSDNFEAAEDELGGLLGGPVREKKQEEEAGEEL